MMWTSKLGNKYNKEEIEASHKQQLRFLEKLRSEPDNRICAECGKQGTVWSSVNLGVFTCLRCGSLHRALGTHISKPKGCTGTYLWGPDEIARMQEVGNKRATQLYGGVEEIPHVDASDEEWFNYLKDKYERRKFMSRSTNQTQYDLALNIIKTGEHGNYQRDASGRRKFVPQLSHHKQHDIAEDVAKTSGYRKRNDDSLATGDLLGLGTKLPDSATGGKDDFDFFAQFGV
mmetsp:Transcript_9385/g.12522  ORF Transcript_9385/g.12522 Transcript_9385/m.12522 type:complete len:231 (-) Transcript_9385:411-1103(-)